MSLEPEDGAEILEVLGGHEVLQHDWGVTVQTSDQQGPTRKLAPIVFLGAPLRTLDLPIYAGRVPHPPHPSTFVSAYPFPCSLII